MRARYLSLFLTAAAVVVAAGWWLTTRPGSDTPLPTAVETAADPAATTAAGLRYDAEYPAIGYTTTQPTDRVARFAAQLARGGVRLERHPDRGYLDALLAALEIDVASQMLVFSKTSLQVEQITAATPRAIYFNDDTYVAWVPGANAIEIATLDTALGPVFYTLGQADAPRFEQQYGRCLRCHDSLSLTGGGVPRFITGSGYTSTEGHIVAHEGWILTSDRTPLRSRWGGWYVTGYHGEQVHLGNIAVRSVNELQQLESLRTGNLDVLDSVLDTSPYPTNRSDIVALMVLEHQVRAQNAIVRASYDVRSALAAAGFDGATDPAVLAGLGVDIEPLVEALLLVGEAPLTDRIEGTSGFAEQFVARGVRDDRGRTLRELDLTTRLFKYPLSYVINGDAFAALPEIAKQHVYGRVRAVLSGRDDLDERYAYLADVDRAAMLEILRATNSGFAASAAD